MKKTALLLIFAFCITAIGCGRIYGPIEEVKAFADEKEEVLSQMAKKLEANPTEAGLDEARKIFEAKKQSLKAKKEAIKAAPQGMNADWYSLLMKTESRHQEMLRGMGIKFTVACDFGQSRNKELCKDKWKELEKSVQETDFHQRR